MFSCEDVAEAVTDTDLDIDYSEDMVGTYTGFVMYNSTQEDMTMSVTKIDNTTVQFNSSFLGVSSSSMIDLSDYPSLVFISGTGNMSNKGGDGTFNYTQETINISFLDNNGSSYYILTLGK